ncbi:MAG: hypothetical protein ABI426_09825 [Flavobacterium sp.]
MGAALQTILDEITAIKDNGNNTAAALRRVLTDMTEYSNNGFEISIDKVVSTDIQMYQYSFKGTKKQCCNGYLLLMNKTNPNPSTGATPPDGGMFSFEIQQPEYEILRDFIPDIDEDRAFLGYTLQTFRNDIRVFTVIVLKKTLVQNQTKYFVMLYTELPSGEGVITTIPLNYIKTVFPPDGKKEAASFNKMFTAFLKTRNIS